MYILSHNQITVTIVVHPVNTNHVEFFNKLQFHGWMTKWNTKVIWDHCVDKYKNETVICQATQYTVLTILKLTRSKNIFKQVALYKNCLHKYFIIYYFKNSLSSTNIMLTWSKALLTFFIRTNNHILIDRLRH